MNESQHESLDRITAARLAKLASRPVDTSRLERQLSEAAADQTRLRPQSRAFRLSAWRRPLAGAVAAVLATMFVAWLLVQGGASVAVAAPADLAKIHFDTSGGLSPAMPVHTLEEANRLLAEQSNGSRPLPRDLPGQVRSCCLHEYAGTTLSCVVIEMDGHLITVALADAARLQCPGGQAYVRDGRRFMAHTADGVNMVMTHENDRWLCVMGQTDVNTLLDVATGIVF